MWRILIFLCLLPIQDVLAVELIAHRGYTCRALENTSNAVSDAWLAKADGVELDLRVSSDGVILVYHDEKVGRRVLSDMTFDEIDGVANHAVPTFKSILDLGPPDGYYILDLKEAGSDAYRRLGPMISASGIDPRRFLVQSKSVDVLAEVRDTLPGAAYFYLTRLERKFPRFKTPAPDKVLARIEGAGLEGVSLKGRKSIDKDFVEHIKDAGYRVFVWTINDPGRATYYHGIGVDGLITDALEVLRSELEPEREPRELCFGVGADASQPSAPQAAPAPLTVLAGAEAAP